MPCDIVLNLPSPIYTDTQISIVDGTDNICDNYSLSISGPTTGPILNTSFSISGLNKNSVGGGNPSIVFDGSSNPIYKLTFQAPGTYNYSYAVSTAGDPVCENDAQGTFIVLERPTVGEGDCMDDFIKFRTLRCRGEQFTESKSGLYFEDLEGLSISNIADITTDKYKSYTDFVNKRTSFATKLIMEELLVRMPDNRFRDAIRSHVHGRFSDRYLPVSAVERGLVIAKHYSPLSYIFVEFVSMKSNTTKTGHNIKIFGGTPSNPINLQNFTIDLVAGQKTRIETKYKSFSGNVYVVSDNSDVLVNDSNMSACYRDEDCCSDHYAWGTKFLTSTGWDGTNGNSNTYGIRAEYSIRCDKSLLFCKLAQELKMAILYRAGVEILKEWGLTDRVNFISIFGSEWAAAKQKEWFEQSMLLVDIAMDGLTEYLTDLDVLCLPCQGNRVVNLMP